jgi:asparagine synthase (glutamine-hydrolysing)
LQTPQREWLRGPLAKWTEVQIETSLHAYGGTWLDADIVRAAWQEYLQAGSDNSFYIWQWVSLGLLTERMGR